MWFNPRYHNFICVKISPFFCHAFVAVNQLCTIALQLCEVHHHWLWSCSKHWYSGPCKPTQTWIACDVCRPPPLYFAPLWPGFRLVLHNKARYCSTCKREQTRPNARQNKLPMQSDAIFSRARYSKKSLIHGKDAVEHLEHCKRNNNRLFLRQAHCIVWVRQSIWCYGDIQKRKMSKAQ